MSEARSDPVAQRRICAALRPAEVAGEQWGVIGWDQLRAWIGRDAEKRALAQRIERANEEWERLGSGREGLWSRRQLREVDSAGADRRDPSILVEHDFSENAVVFGKFLVAVVRILFVDDPVGGHELLQLVGASSDRLSLDVELLVGIRGVHGGAAE